jgi:hypothetical protein
MGPQDVAELVELRAGEPAGHHAELIWQVRGQTGHRVDVGGGDDEDFLGTDLWRAGRWWGDLVASTWEAAVRASLDAARTEAERRSTL